MDSGNRTEALGQADQPVDAVVADAEITKTTPQVEATDEQELYVDVEADQQETANSMDERQIKAAWKEEKRKRKERTAEAKAEKLRADDLETKVRELESRVNNVSRGEKPDPFDFDNKEDFYTALDVWQDHGKKDKVKPEEAKASKPLLSDDQEYHLHISETAIKKSFKDYDEVKARVSDELNRAFGLKSDYPITEEIAQYAHTYDADPAKVFYALEKMPSKINDLVKSAGNPAQIGRILRDLDSKIKVRERKSIDSKPEPQIRGGGPVNMLTKEAEKAFTVYKENPTQANHELLTAARKRIKDSKKESK